MLKALCVGEKEPFRRCVLWKQGSCVHLLAGTRWRNIKVKVGCSLQAQAGEASLIYFSPNIARWCISRAGGADLRYPNKIQGK